MIDNTISEPNQKTVSVEQSPEIKRLFQRIPANVAKSFTPEQIIHLKSAINNRGGEHSIDVRGTVSLFKWRYYYVVLIGKNKRTLSTAELRMAKLINTIFLTGLITFILLISLLTIYIIKSALGINVFEHFSLGIWDWFKSNFLT
ncbi:3-phosphoshikimate 1-carboxyvinyltransferase [Catenovulum sp. SX2]|uniref:3-phosphoshikimate 1-carboxyvinyltransferase n=1 Tax=Catenovulum sp. SX2 TaxID=3398614 RepID=UPI003F87F46E